MSDIFGPDTSRITLTERRVAEKLVKGREILYPVFDGQKLISIYQESMNGKRDNFGVDVFGMFEKEMLIPYDFIDIPRQDFLVPISNKRKIKEYRSEYRKFIARPDFLYVGFENGKAHVFPVDLKSCATRGINQISMMNSAMLYFHSNYMQKIVNYLKNDLESKVVFENGFFLLNEELSDSNKNNLEEYISRFLSNSIQKRDREVGEIGIKFSGGKPKLLGGLDSSFVSDLDYDVSSISESKMIAYFSFIKGRISGTTTYPNMVCSINGFNGGRKPIFRLDFDPTSHIKTYNPQIEVIEGAIESIYEMDPNYLFDNYSFGNLSFIEKSLIKLHIELDAKIRDRDFRIEKRVDENMTCSSVRKSKNYSVTINRVEKKIAEIEKKIVRAKSELILEVQNMPLIKPKKGSLDWHNKSCEIRNRLISRRNIELEKEREKEYNWEKKDVKLSQLISNFYLNSLFNDNFTLAENPYFSLPQELYLQLDRTELRRVLLFNSFKIN